MKEQPRTRSCTPNSAEIFAKKLKLRRVTHHHGCGSARAAERWGVGGGLLRAACRVQPVWTRGAARRHPVHSPAMCAQGSQSMRGACVACVRACVRACCVRASVPLTGESRAARGRGVQAYGVCAGGAGPELPGMGKMGGGAAAAALLLALLGEAGAFYLPGVAPRKYRTGERMRVKVNTLTSDLTPLQASASRAPCVPALLPLPASERAHGCAPAASTARAISAQAGRARGGVPWLLSFSRG